MAKPATPSSTKKGRAAAKPGGGASFDADAADQGLAPNDNALPGKEEIAALMAPVRAFMQSARHVRIRDFLGRLALRPPQVVLLEGGTAEERTAAAFYWSLILNCARMHGHVPGHTHLGDKPGGESPPQKAAPGGLLAMMGAPEPLTAAEPPVQHPVEPEFFVPQTEPCFDCSECVRMIACLHRDFFFLDGLAGSIKIDDVRAVRGILGEPPREARYRMVIFREAQAIQEAAANALLKSFEEPRPATSFVLLAPQRERLLPTLVSRSVSLTLPWPDSGLRGDLNATLPAVDCLETPRPAPSGRPGAQLVGSEECPAPEEKNHALIAWEAALCTFLRTGRGLFERTAVRGAVDAPQVQGILGFCRRALARRILALQTEAAPAEGIESCLARLPAARLRMVDEVLAECQDSLVYNVNPTLVLEWMATRLYLLSPR